jgi:hypothetical protein
MADDVKTILDTLNAQRQADRLRASTIDSVLLVAAEKGVDAALKDHGASLSDADKNLLKSLHPDEIKTFSSVSRKLTPLRNLAADNNNNL